MARSRKTFEVEELKNKINHQLQQPISKDAKQALCLLLNTVLCETNNANGFQFSGKNKTPNVDDKGFYERTYY